MANCIFIDNFFQSDGNQNQLNIILCYSNISILYNVGSVHQGDTMGTLGGYHEYIRGYLEYIRGCSVCTLGGYRDSCG